MPGKYTDDFFELLSEGSLDSARIVLPIIVDILDPQSVIDVGCGQGAWLSILKELGVPQVLGIDGDYINRDKLKISEHEFRVQDLSQPLSIKQTFDLVMSLEVAEHISEEKSDEFIKSLTSLGKVILFSAAIPGQGGTDHVNEQWPSYWMEKFISHGYLPVDCIRERVWSDEKVMYWYAQNILIFAQKDYLKSCPQLFYEYEKQVPIRPDLVHPKNYWDKCQEVSRLQELVGWYKSQCDPKKMLLKDFLMAAPTVFLNGISRTFSVFFTRS